MARPHADDEGVEAAADRVEDLQRGRLPVRLGVRRVLELLGHEILRMLAEELAGGVHRARHPLDRRREVELGAEARQEALPLDAHVVRHRQDQPVALDRRRHRQADAGVAAGGLDDRRARLQEAASLGVIEHGDGDAVLDAPAGVQRLELCHDDRPVWLGQAVQPNHRRPPDQLEDGTRNLW